MTLARALLLVSGFALLHGPAAAGSWSRMYALPSSATLNGVTFANGELVAVGAESGVFESADALTWTDRSTGNTTATLRGVLADGTDVFAYGTNGAPLLYRSASGGAYQPVHVGGDGVSVTALAVADRYLAFTEQGAVRESDDGLTWSDAVAEPVTILASATAAAHAGGLTVVVAQTGLISSSTDGVTWTQRASTGVILTDVIFAGGQWLAVSSGSAFTSPDGTTWTPRPYGAGVGAMRAVTHDGAQYVAVGFSGATAASADGVTWTGQGSGLSDSHNLVDVVWTGVQFVAVGTLGALATSPDGVAWTVLSASERTALTELGALGNLLVASGFRDTAQRTRIATRTGAGPWIDQGEQPDDVEHLDYVAHAGALFAAMADDEVGLVGRSVDGVNWTNLEVHADAGLRVIVSSGALLVAAADSEAVYTSPDGTAWTRQRNGADGTPLNAGVWTGTQFVLVGDEGFVMRSPDGINWTTGTVTAGETTLRLVAVAFGNALLIAANENGGTFTSADGAAWAAGSSGLTVLSDLVHSGQGFVAVGGTGIATRSVNGTDWTQESMGTAVAALTVAALDGALYAAGPDLMILTAPASNNTPPTTSEDTFTIKPGETLNATLTAADVNGGTLTYTLVNPPRFGSVTITNPNTGAFTFVPPAEETGTAAFSFRVTDGQADSVPATVTVRVRRSGGGGGALGLLALLLLGAVAVRRGRRG